VGGGGVVFSVNHVHQAQHADPVWRDRANFIIATAIEPFGPGIESEQLWSRRVEDRVFELCCIPFFTYGLALGDLVVTAAGEGYMVQDRVEQSGRSVFRAIFSRQGHGTAENVNVELLRKGALVEWYSATYLAVDARDAAHAKEIEDFLREQQSLENLEYERGN
jgi:hypothetical protein